MSDKSGISSEIISLPQGGGALHGLGEKFSADLHHGTGNLSVPIVVPAGRNGFEPQLVLGYSTGAGNGPFGLGWTLGVPGVSRRTARGVPRYDEDGDIYILSGAEDLVAVAGRFPGRVRYRPRTEGLFALIERQLDASDDFWEVRSKDGLISIYGTPGRRGDDPAALTDPDHMTHVFAWRLTETRDPFGNRIVYEYRSDEGDADGHRWRQPLLKRIRYVDYTDDGGRTRYLASVALVYDDESFPGDARPQAPRPDPFSEYNAGFEIRTSRRCTGIVTATHAGADRLVRGYRLVYLDERAELPDLAERLPQNGVSLLSQIQVVGYDDAGQPQVELPPVELDYSAFEPRTRRDFFPLSGNDLPPGGLGRAEYEMADVTGDGLPDIVEMNGTVRYWPNAGEGRFDGPRPIAEAPAGLSLADPGVRLMDADGDGRIDLFVTTGALNGYFPLQHDGGWDRRSFRPHASAPSFALDDPEVKLVDLDGDGVTDALRTGSRLEHYFNDPAKGWHDVRLVERRPLDEFPDVVFSDSRVRLAAMAGSLQDIVYVTDGSVEYWPNRGHGAWGRRISMRGSPRFPSGHDPRRILLGDVDGDGLADLVYVDDTQVTLWINRAGNAWSDPIVIEGTPPVTDVDAVRLVDLLGSGVGGVLWSADQDGLGRPRSFFLDLTGGGKPYLLDQIDNHVGAITEVRYAASTVFSVADARDPRTRWRTTLPFPVQVVAATTVTDVFSGTRLSSEFRYHHGSWDGGEREFRGFGMVEQFDAEASLTVDATGTPLSPPTCTKTWFHQGPVGPEEGDWFEVDLSDEHWPDDPPGFPRHPDLDALLRTDRLPRRAKRDALRALRGQAVRSELYALDGSPRAARPYTVTEAWLSAREEDPPAAGEPERSRIFFAQVRGQRTTEWQRGADPLTRFAFNDDYDACGQPRLQTQVACPRGWRALADRPGQPYLATRVRTTFATPSTSGPYIHDRVASVTTRELVNDGRLTVAELLQLPDGALPIVSQTLTFYDRDPSQARAGAFVGLPLGTIGDFGALVHTEELALTDARLIQIYGAESPAYLGVASSIPVSSYPTEFIALLVPVAGYVDRRSGPPAGVVPGLFVVGQARGYDFHVDAAGRGRGLVVATRDPLGHETTIAHDAYALLPVAVTDPLGNVARATYDYRTLQPAVLVDSNGNETITTFTPLGPPASIQRRGKSGDGDQARPSVRFRYDFLAYAVSPPDRPQPISTTTIRHLHHDTETDVPLPARVEVIESRQYSDGFGRVLQTRTQSDDARFGSPLFGGGDGVLPMDQSVSATADVVGQPRVDPQPPNVVVSGWQRYDNKGRVIEKCDPFFSAGWGYVPPGTQELRRGVRMVYDPRGIAVRTVNPDGSEQRVVPGVPAALDDPEHFEPTPWETYTYDANDNAGRTHRVSSAAYRGHWDTPSSVTVDALGRMITESKRNGRAASDAYTTRFAYDSRGNLLTVTDPLGRPFAYVFDHLGRRLRCDSIDAGAQSIVLDAAGRGMETRDAKGALTLAAYDSLGRSTHVWARDRTGEPITLRERLVYGDDPASGLASAAVGAGNLRGRLYRHYDEAGRLTIAYDFKGNQVDVLREVIAPTEIAAVFAASPGWRVPAYRVDWASSGGTSASALAARASTLLAATGYVTTFAYDALDRVKTMQYPRDAGGRRAVLRRTYNRAGAVARVEIDGQAYMERVAYDARDQRVLVVYGNGVMTRLAYDPTTARLTRLRTERYASPAPLTYRPLGSALQDLAYDYDLAGHIVAIHDRAPLSGIPAQPDSLDRWFTYDPLYRLRTATGRECDTPAPAPPWDDTVHCNDISLTRAYTEDYTYDPADNLTIFAHTAGSASFRRDFTLVGGTNRLADVTIGPATYRYAYDQAGNLERENTDRHFEWDHRGRLRVFRVQTAAAGAPPGSGQLAEPTTHAYYLYDALGERVMKLVRAQGGAIDVTVYVGGGFEHRRWTETGQARESTSVHVTDGQRRVAIVRAGDPGDGGPDVQYHLGDHLDSSHVVVGGSRPTDATWIAREEYSPYGETSFGGFARKRYRFGGKERDEESGCSYFGARYYASWLGRWTSADPAASTTNLYAFVSGNPINLVDPHGRQEVSASDMWNTTKQGWNTTKQGISKANKAIHDTAAMAGQGYIDAGELIIDSAGIENETAKDLIRAKAVDYAIGASTAGEFVAGFAMLGPNLLMLPEALTHVPEQLGGGASEIAQGIEQSDTNRALLGVASVMGGVGVVASVIAGVAGAGKAAYSRSSYGQMQSAVAALAKEPPGIGIPWIKAPNSMNQLLNGAMKVVEQSGLKSLGERAELIRGLYKQMSERIAWKFEEGTGADGSAIFFGKTGLATVVAPDGVVYRMTISERIEGAIRDGIYQPPYDSIAMDVLVK